MFVFFQKGKPNTFNLIKDRKKITAGANRILGQKYDKTKRNYEKKRKKKIVNENLV
ncbi:MAG: hypothetical protein CM15mV109_190 [uncultured marine virus]|nr:MAG: hypothetical protein CM15mV109_190 [uncultured marine virus]